MSIGPAISIATPVRAAVGAVLAAFGGLILCVALAGHVDDLVRTPWPVGPAWQMIPIEFSYDDYPLQEGRHSARIQLYLRDPSVLAIHDGINVLLGLYGTQPRLVEGRLTIVGTGCVYRTAATAELHENSHLPFNRGPDCVRLRGTPTGLIELAIVFEGAGRLGAWGAVPPKPTDDPTTIYIGQMQVLVAWRPLLHGYYADTVGPSSKRRIDMLAHVWQLRPTSAWIWGMVALTTLLIAAGVAIFPTGPAAAEPRVVLRAGAGAGAIAAALACTYAFLVPPFQAPDEPDHLLSYAFATNRWRLATDARSWARTIHFDRVRSGPQERFSPADVSRPAAIAWDPAVVFEEDVEARSGATFAWWSAAARAIDPAGGVDVRGAPATLFALRLFNVLFFALAVGAGTALVVWCARDAPFPQLACFVFFFVPALPFFAMHVSEYAIMTSAYVLLACGLLAQFLDGSRSEHAGAGIGIATGVLLASGRSAFPMLPVIAGALVARAIQGARADSARTRSAAVFWIGLLASVPVFLLCTGERYRAEIGALIAAREWAPAAGLLRPAALGLVATGAAIAGAGIEIAVTRLRARVRVSAAWRDVSTRLAAAALAAAPVVSIGMSWRASALPHPVSIETESRPAAAAYVGQVIGTMATTFRVREPDLYLSSSFWGGFGWLETRLNDALVTAFVLATAVAWMALLIHLGIGGDGRRVVQMVLLLAAAAATIYLYAVLGYALYRNVHGRYLVGFYLALLAPMWSVPILRPDPAAARLRPALTAVRVWLLLGACLVIHALTWGWLIRRYF